MIIVGVTGSFSSGKNAVSGIFKKLGAKIFDADISARNATRKGTAVHRAIAQIFGKAYLDKKGVIDRRKLAFRVFSQPKDLRKLNILVHPQVIFEALKFIKKYKGRKGIAVLNAPLLYEARMEKLVDVVIVVTAKQKSIIERAAKRGVNIRLAKKIVASQWPLARKVRHADFVIENDGSMPELAKKVRQIFHEITTGGNFVNN